MLKSFEKELTQFRYEHLLNFLINDMIKSKFFQNENYEKYMELANKIKIKSGLINNIENEFLQEEKMLPEDKKI